MSATETVTAPAETEAPPAAPAETHAAEAAAPAAETEAAPAPPAAPSAAAAPAAPVKIPEGHLGALTAAEEKKLQQAWLELGRICGFVSAENGTSSGDATKAAKANVKDDPNDKYGQSKQFLKYLSEQKPEDVRTAFWSMAKQENPDALLLRFLRARKWEVDKAMVMLISTIQWRQESRVEEQVNQRGEAAALDEKRSKDEDGFMLQYRSGKSYVHGVDREGRPLYVIKVRLHDPKAQSERAMEMFILHSIESIRLLAQDPFDTSMLIFDLTNFSLRNMDFAAVKFIVKVFEANYPENLGLVAVHKAPWVFSGLWRIIRGWLDPVVASKIHFTSSAADLDKFVERDMLQKEYGGNDPWEYEYAEPVAGENERLADTASRDAAQKERDTLTAEYEKLAVAWAATDATGDEGQGLMKQRLECAGKLRANYFRLDPFIRARNFYDRTGVIDEQGNINATKVGITE